MEIYNAIVSGRCFFKKVSKVIPFNHVKREFLHLFGFLQGASMESWSFVLRYTFKHNFCTNERFVIKINIFRTILVVKHGLLQ